MVIENTVYYHKILYTSVFCMSYLRPAQSQIHDHNAEISFTKRSIPRKHVSNTPIYYYKLWDLLSLPEIVERAGDRLVRVFVSRVAILPGFRRAERGAPSPLEHPILELPSACIPRGFCFGHVGLVADPVPHFPLILTPLGKGELLLQIPVLRLRLLERMVGRRVGAQVLGDARPHVAPLDVVAVHGVEGLVRCFRGCCRLDRQIGNESCVGAVVNAVPVHLVCRHGSVEAQFLLDQEVEGIGQR